MSLVDNLASLYNLAAVVLVGAATLTSPPAHALTGLGHVSLDNRTLETLYWAGQVNIKHSFIGHVYVDGVMQMSDSIIGATTHIGQLDATNIRFTSDVDLTTGLTTFTDSSIAGNLTIHNRGNGKPEIYLNNTAVGGNVVCDVEPCPVFINKY